VPIQLNVTPREILYYNTGSTEVTTTGYRVGIRGFQGSEWVLYHFIYVQKEVFVQPVTIGMAGSQGRPEATKVWDYLQN